MKIEILRHCLFLAAVVTGMTLSAAHAAAPEQITIDPRQVTTLAGDLRGTEGPSALPDGSVAVLETMGGTVVQVNADGTRKVLTAPGSGVAGSAVGRDNALYVTKINLAGLINRGGPPGGGGPPPGIGSVKPSPAAVIRIDLSTGDVRNIYTAYQGTLLKEPNDLVVDKWGDLWFTDSADDGAVYWARTDGSDIKLMISDIKGVNGIALSPNRRSIYIVGNGKLLAYTISGRGKLKQANGRAAARELATLDANLGSPDGMKTEANGDILLACWADGILRYSSKGEFLSQTKFPGLSIVNLAFGGKDGRTLYLSDRVGSGVGGAGQLQSVTWPRPGTLFP
jgi:gluconolactonase